MSRTSKHRLRRGCIKLVRTRRDSDEKLLIYERKALFIILARSLVGKFDNLSSDLNICSLEQYEG